MKQIEVAKQAQNMTESQGQQAKRVAAACRESRRVLRERNTCTCFCCQYDRLYCGDQS